VIPTMYIPMSNWVSAIAEKKATTRFFPSVSAYKLSKKYIIVSASLLRGRLAVLLETLVREGCTRRMSRFEETQSCHICVLDENSKTVEGESVHTSRMVRFVYYPRKTILTR